MIFLTLDFSPPRRGLPRRPGKLYPGDVRPLCEAHGCSFAQLAEAWALAQYPNMSLLVGMRRPASVADTARCLALRLSAEELALLEQSVKSIQVKVLDK